MILIFVSILLIGVGACSGAELPVATSEAVKAAGVDWLVTPVPQPARVFRSEDRAQLIMTNGLIRRTWRIKPNAACVAFDNLMTGASLLRGVKPEAIVTIDGHQYEIGGLKGQRDYAYLTDEWARELSLDSAAMRLTRWEAVKTAERFAWKRVRHHDQSLSWPPPGVSLRLEFVPGEPAPGEPALPKGLSVSVHYEMYDGIPLMAKWLSVHNASDRPIELNAFASEVLAIVESESAVDSRKQWTVPGLHVESDYAFGGMDATTANHTTYWVPDPQYQTQVNYERKTPCLLESRPPIGPEVTIPSGGTFQTFRTFELVYDSTDRERNGLAQRRMYRTLAPWVTENPIMMHVTSSDPAAVRRAIDQCADVGFEMLILSFGSGINLESTDRQYIERYRELSEYARQKGIELGGYSLLASRHIDDADDCVNPKTGKPGGAIFGNSPCLGSRWGEAYFQHVDNFLHQAQFGLLEHDGSYPGDVCASTTHPGHKGLDDSQWTQWSKIVDFYRQCRADGIYLNVPDWYFLNGSNKAGMGYRESNWSLPRDQQLIHARQNMYDGTWEKTPSMGWMFVPLVQYQGGGAAATIEPLSKHLDTYAAHLANYFGYGVQACYRGPRLYDTEATEKLVRHWVDFFKQHRVILESDEIHLRRADGRDWDGILHVNPHLDERGLAMIYNPTDHRIETEIKLPLYYTGLTDRALVSEPDGVAQTYTLDRAYTISVHLGLQPHGSTWLSIRVLGQRP